MNQFPGKGCGWRKDSIADGIGRRRNEGVMGIEYEEYPFDAPPPPFPNSIYRQPKNEYCIALNNMVLYNQKSIPLHA
jgi:hypothetical protein